MKAIPILLIALGVVTLGAKIPIAFCIWSITALGCVAWLFWKRPGEFQSAFTPALILAFLIVLIGQGASREPSTSLFWTTQVLVYLLLWPTLRCLGEKSFDSKELGWMMYGLAFFTLFLTSYQHLSHQPPFGFLPVNPNFNATWIAILIMGLLGRLLFSRSFWERAIALILSLLLLGLLLVGSARGALVALIIAGLGLSSSYFHRKYVGIIVLLLMGIALAFPQFWLTRFRVTNQLQDHRADIWAVAIKAVKDHPITGYGLGNFEIAYQRHAFAVPEHAVQYGRTTEFAHNEFLQILAELGLPAFLLISGIIVSVYRKRRQPDSPERHWMKAMFGVCLISACFNPIWHIPFLVCVTLMLGAALEGVPSATPVSPRQRSIFRFGFWGIFVGTFLLATWIGLRALLAYQQQWSVIVRINPYDATAWQALNRWDKSIELSPENVYLREDFASYLEQAADPDARMTAVRQYETAVALAPYRAIDHLALGRWAFIMHRYDEAAKRFTRAKQLEPRYWEADLWLACTQYQLGHRHEAIHILQTLPEQLDQFAVSDLLFKTPHSAYEKRILAYDPLIVEKELRRFQSLNRNTIIR